MEVFFLLGLVLAVISILILIFSFKKLRGTFRIIGMIIGYILLFISGMGIYLGVVIT